VNCPPLPNSLSFWVELVSACNSIWYQSQRSQVRILVSAIKLNNCYLLLFHVWGLREPPREGKCWNISELPTSPQQLKLLGWTGWCMQLNNCRISHTVATTTSLVAGLCLFLHHPIVGYSLFHTPLSPWDENSSCLPLPSDAARIGVLLICTKLPVGTWY